MDDQESCCWRARRPNDNQQLHPRARWAKLGLLTRGGAVTFNLFCCRRNFSPSGANPKETAVVSGPDQLPAARCDPRTVPLIQQAFAVGPTTSMTLIQRDADGVKGVKTRPTIQFLEVRMLKVQGFGANLRAARLPSGAAVSFCPSCATLKPQRQNRTKEIRMGPD